MLDEHYLVHHGILGMKWGVRRSAKMLAKARLARGESDEPKRSNSSGEESAKTAGKGGSAKPVADDGPLSDDELRNRINRMTMEKTYQNLLSERNPKRESAVRKLVTDAAKNAGQQVLSRLVTNGVNSIFDRKKDKFDFNEYSSTDISKMNPEMIKRVADWYSNALKIDTGRTKLTQSGSASGSGSSQKP